MAGTSKQITHDAAMSMRAASMKVHEALQSVKGIYNSAQEALADSGRPAGAAFSAYYASALAALEELSRALDILKTNSSLRNSSQVDSACDIAYSINRAANAAHELGIDGCESIAKAADKICWEFGELAPRKARKQSQTYFMSLSRHSRSLLEALKEFDVTAALQIQDRETYENVLTVIESIGSSLEYASKL